MLLIFTMIALQLALPARSFTVTQIIGVAGHGAGNTLAFPAAIAIVSRDNRYLTAVATDNGFRMMPSNPGPTAIPAASVRIDVYAALRAAAKKTPRL